MRSILDYARSPEATVSAAIDPVFNITQITNEARKRTTRFRQMTQHDQRARTRGLWSMRENPAGRFRRTSVVLRPWSGVERKMLEAACGRPTLGRGAAVERKLKTLENPASHRIVTY